MHTDTHTTTRKSVQIQTSKSSCGSRSRQGLSMARMSASQIVTACCYKGGDMTSEIHSPVKKDVSVVAWDAVAMHFRTVLLVMFRLVFCEYVLGSGAATSSNVDARPSMLATFFFCWYLSSQNTALQRWWAHSTLLRALPKRWPSILF